MKQVGWRVLIVDDEPAALRVVRQLLAAFPEFAVAGECRNGAEALAALDASAPDVVFLDIQMPGIDGFEVIRRRTVERMPEVVFLTAFDQFALRAFDAEALDYLVKPVSEARFAATMKRLMKRLRSSATAARDENIVVTTSRGATVLNVGEIDWIEAAGNYSQLWVGPRSYFLRESLQSLEERVRKHGFVRSSARAGSARRRARVDTRQRGRAGRGARLRRAHPGLTTPKRGLRGGGAAARQGERF